MIAASRIFDLLQDPQERYDITMNSYTEHTWIAPVMGAELKRVMKTFIDYPPRKLQSDAYSGPVTISAWEKFGWLRDQLKKDGFNMSLPSGNYFDCETRGPPLTRRPANSPARQKPQQCKLSAFNLSWPPRFLAWWLSHDILLLPDATMIEHAEAVNARLRAVFPEGFALDAAHHPHISMFQCYVRTADLDKVYATANKVLAAGNITALRLKAFKYYYLPDKTLGLSGIVIEPTPALVKLQEDLIAAVAPLTVKTATSTAFVTGTEPVINPLLIKYVEVFATEHAGKHFEPHVTTGLAPREYLDKMLAEPFADFTFSPAGAAVYHLGHYGTAAKKLKQFDLKP